MCVCVHERYKQTSCECVIWSEGHEWTRLTLTSLSPVSFLLLRIAIPLKMASFCFSNIMKAFTHNTESSTQKNALKTVTTFINTHKQNSVYIYQHTQRERWLHISTHTNRTVLQRIERAIHVILNWLQSSTISSVHSEAGLLCNTVCVIVIWPRLLWSSVLCQVHLLNWEKLRFPLIGTQTGWCKIFWSDGLDADQVYRTCWSRFESQINGSDAFIRIMIRFIGLCSDQIYWSKTNTKTKADVLV